MVEIREKDRLAEAITENVDKILKVERECHNCVYRGLSWKLVRYWYTFLEKQHDASKLK